MLMTLIIIMIPSLSSGSLPDRPCSSTSLTNFQTFAINKNINNDRNNNDDNDNDT